MKKTLCLVLALLMTGPMTATAAATSSSSVDITLRVAPEGFVLPSHWTTGHEAQWIVDPVEDTSHNDEKGIAGCRLDVPDGDGDGKVGGTQVLDHAADSGCILGWDSYQDEDFGTYITAVDGRNETNVTGSARGRDLHVAFVWWMIQTNGTWADSGIDGIVLTEGSSLSFIYYAGA